MENRSVIYVDLCDEDKDEYEMMEKILYLAHEFDNEMMQLVNMEIFCSSNKAFIKKFHDLIIPLLCEGKKVVALGAFRRMITTIHYALKNEFSFQYPVFEFYNKLPMDEKQTVLSNFETSESGALLLATNGLSTGVVIKEASYLFHLDVPNSINTITQRNRRVRSSENYFLISKNTLQENKYEKIKHQQKIIDEIAN